MDATQEKMSKEKAEAVDVLFPANVYNYDDFCFPSSNVSYKTMSGNCGLLV